MFRKAIGAVLAISGILGLSTAANAQYLVPQVSTHIDYVPHTTTQLQPVIHGNHYDMVPHTTTHYDAVPHTTTHVGVVPYATSRVVVTGGYPVYRPGVVAPLVRAAVRPLVPVVAPRIGVVPRVATFHYGY